MGSLFLRPDCFFGNDNFLQKRRICSNLESRIVLLLIANQNHFGFGIVQYIGSLLQVIGRINGNGDGAQR